MRIRMDLLCSEPHAERGDEWEEKDSVCVIFFQSRAGVDVGEGREVS